MQSFEPPGPPDRHGCHGQRRAGGAALPGTKHISGVVSTCYPSRVDTRKLSGLEYMQAVVAGQIPMPPMAQTIPMQCIQAEPGGVVFTACADDRHLNRADNVHGGFTATVIDSVTSCALRTRLEAGVGFVTIELNIKLLRPVPRAAELRVEGKVIHVSRRLGTAEARLFDSQRNLCAFGTATFMLERPVSPDLPPL